MKNALWLCLLAAGSCLAADSGGYYLGWPTNGWPQSTPEQQGMDSQLLEDMAVYAQANIPGTDSLLVVRDGYLVFERYFRSQTQDRPHSIYSVTKTVTGALVGMAIADGRIQSANQHVADFYRDIFTPFVRPLKQTITVQHCLTLTSGWSDPPFEKTLDWYSGTIRSNLNFRPGENWEYMQGQVGLLAGIIERTTGASYAQFAYQRLFQPLGIVRPPWDTDPLGHAIAFTGLSLTPRDMAKFGYLLVREGLWEDRQLVPAAWVREASAGRARVVDGAATYGYLGWVWQAAGHPVYEGSGWGGQHIWMIPDLRMVVVTTVDAAVTGDNVPWDLQAKLVTDYAIRSLRGEQ